MTEGKLGYDQIKKLAMFGIAFAEAVIAASDSNKTSLQKAVEFMSCIDEAADLLTLDRQMLYAQWDDFDAEERQELMRECQEAFSLEDQTLEQRVEQSIEAGLCILEAVERSVNVWRGLKSA